MSYDNNYAIKQLERKLDELYTETESNLPPSFASPSERQWNDGFYRGQLKALELVCERLFGKSGDELAPTNNGSNKLGEEEQ